MVSPPTKLQSKSVNDRSAVGMNRDGVVSNVTYVRLLQLANAYQPMFVALAGTDNVARLVQEWKA